LLKLSANAKEGKPLPDAGAVRGAERGGGLRVAKLYPRKLNLKATSESNPSNISFKRLVPGAYRVG
jgi:hypothetical protein